MKHSLPSNAGGCAPNASASVPPAARSARGVTEADSSSLGPRPAGGLTRSSQDRSPLRAEILRGDLRVAYLAWLLAVQSYDVGDEDQEPPVPPGLTDLTGAQQAMVDFLRIDTDLLSAAGEQSAAVPDERAALSLASSLTRAPK